MFPTSVRLTTIKPDWPPVYILRGCAEGIEPIFKPKFESVAQLVERLTLNQNVAGSIPAGFTAL